MTDPPPRFDVQSSPDGLRADFPRDLAWSHGFSLFLAFLVFLGATLAASTVGMAVLSLVGAGNAALLVASIVANIIGLATGVKALTVLRRPEGDLILDTVSVALRWRSTSVSVPLEEVRSLQRTERELQLETASGDVMTFGAGLTPHELDWVEGHLTQAVANRRAAMLEDGLDPDAVVRPPPQLQELRSDISPD